MKSLEFFSSVHKGVCESTKNDSSTILDALCVSDAKVTFRVTVLAFAVVPYDCADHAYVLTKCACVQCRNNTAWGWPHE